MTAPPVAVVADAGVVEAAPPPQFIELAVAKGEPAMAHAPLNGAVRAPVVVFLHGMCATPAWECPVFRGAAREAWLLCPAGPAACAGGGRMWVGSDGALERGLGQALDALRANGSDVDAPRAAIIGYSLGAPAALRLASATRGRFRRLMIVNASVTPSAKQLERAGIERIALVAGARDRTAAALKTAASRLERAGVDARFFDLGPVGHYFDASSAERLEPSLAWLTDGL